MVATSAKRVLLPLVVTAALSLAGCGSADPAATDSVATSPTPAATSSSPPASKPAQPDCATVWVAGQRLPKPYRGCLEGTKLQQPELYRCSSGQHVTTYAHKFYAVQSRPIIEVAVSLVKDKAFRTLLADCLA